MCLLCKAHAYADVTAQSDRIQPTVGSVYDIKVKECSFNCFTETILPTIQLHVFHIFTIKVNV